MGWLRSKLSIDWRVLGVYLGGVFLGALDTSVLGPVLPSIAHTFGVTFAWTAWTVTAYTVAFAASTVLAGSLGDRLGRRGVFAAGLGAFGVASALAAVSGSLGSLSFGTFIAARVIQGAGAGAVYPNAQAEGLGQFPAERRGMALGIFGAVFGMAAIVGPNLGGALGQFVGWPAIFALNVPLAALMLAFVARLPRGARRAEGPVPDWVGGLSFAGVLTAVLLAIPVGGASRWLLLVAAAALAALFAWRQRRAPRPFLDRRPLANRAGVLLLAGTTLIGLDLSAAVFVPALTQAKLGLSILGSGVALMPAALTGAVLAGVAGVMVDRRGPRMVVQVGLSAAVVGGVLLAWPHLTLPLFIVAMVALGLATAFTVGAPPNRLVLGLYGDRDEQAAEALSLVAVFRSVGLAAGPVLLTAAETWGRFSGMFGAVAAASLVGVVVFSLVPDVRPGPRPRPAAL